MTPIPQYVDILPCMGCGAEFEVDVEEWERNDWTCRACRDKIRRKCRESMRDLRLRRKVFAEIESSTRMVQRQRTMSLNSVDSYIDGGLYGWVFEKPEWYASPIKMTGQLGLWDLDESRRRK